MVLHGHLLHVMTHLRCCPVYLSGAFLNSMSLLTYTLSGTCLHYQPPEEGDAECIRKGKQEERAYQQIARNLPSAAARIPDFCRGLPRSQGNAGTGSPL